MKDHNSWNVIHWVPQGSYTYDQWPKNESNLNTKTIFTKINDHQETILNLDVGIHVFYQK